MAEAVVVQGFTVIPLKIDEDSPSPHFLYVKEHTVRDSNKEKPGDKTLFVINVPPYCTKESIESLFSACGKVDRVYLHKKPTAGLPEIDKSKFFPTVSKIQGYRVAYVVFRKNVSIRTAKSWSYSKPFILKSKDRVISTGLKKWCSAYTEDFVLNKDRVQTEINKYMADFDKKAQEVKSSHNVLVVTHHLLYRHFLLECGDFAQEIEKAKEMEGVPDEEGWITVTKHGKNKATPFTEARKKHLTYKERKKRKEKELLNFYRFQIRETKKEQIATLRKKFEDDKQRIALMKASRKFRPY